MNSGPLCILSQYPKYSKEGAELVVWPRTHLVSGSTLSQHWKEPHFFWTRIQSRNLGLLPFVTTPFQNNPGTYLTLVSTNSAINNAEHLPGGWLYFSPEIQQEIGGTDFLHLGSSQDTALIYLPPSRGEAEG